MCTITHYDMVIVHFYNLLSEFFCIDSLKYQLKFEFRGWLSETNLRQKFRIWLNKCLIIDVYIYAYKIFGRKWNLK